MTSVPPTTHSVIFEEIREREIMNCLQEKKYKLGVGQDHLDYMQIAEERY